MWKASLPPGQEHGQISNRARDQAWEARRDALQLPRDPVDNPIDQLARWSVGRRHGELAPPAEAQRREALLTARRAVKAFIDYLKARPPGGE